ncbi:MAG: hypothetical protein R2771_02415 [Saprospiraceae bacterium]
MIEKDGIIIDKNNEGCYYTFNISCDNDCKCEAVLLTDVDHDGICDVLDDLIGEECDKDCSDEDLGPCDLCDIQSNPAYDYTDPNNTEPPCIVVISHAPDSDSDGVCDLIDKCPGEDDTIDEDNDGIPDCLDPCIGGDMGIEVEGMDKPVAPGDPCDDGLPCTYGDAINSDCNCEGHEIDLDDDEVPDCQDCVIKFTDPDNGEITVVDIYGPFKDCDNCYSIESAAGNKCDICQGFDDKEDYNGNGIPDCLDPPYKEIGCPDEYFILPGVGVVLKYNSEDILEEDLPQPITITFMEDGVNEVGKYDYLTIESIREVSGQFEVLYAIENINPENPFNYFSVSFADHQNCVFTSSEQLNDLICPTSFGFSNSGDFYIEMDYSAMDGIADIAKFEGAFIFNGGDPMYPKYISVSTTNPAIFHIYFDNFGDFNAESVILPNGIECTYDGNGLISDCLDENNQPIAPGSPCPCDPATMDCDCFTHFRLDNDCNCIGDPKPDTDHDGLCDEIDPCPDYPNSDPEGKDCECPDLELEAPVISETGDISISLDDTGIDQLEGFTITITGGPENEPTILQLPATTPLVIPNMPKGYIYTVTISSNGKNGCSKQQTIELGLPSETNPTFVVLK